MMLAVYGAVLGTVGFILSVYLAIREYKKERRILKVILEYVTFYEHFQVKIVNVNFRPITISSVGGVLLEIGKRKRMVTEGIPSSALLDSVESNLPVTLKDGESAVLKLQDGLSSYYTDEEYKLEVFVYDTEGKLHSQTESKIYDPKYNVYQS
ncbi:MAG TPA: hypothetical protein VJ972_07540 [Anaerolineales bacterium]|nr:hypothetical protein [Anaerolineales bacterium]